MGTVTQCVTGRLATLEEIVDWQPYDHVGWPVAVPDLGPVAVTADLDAGAGGARLRMRWAPGPATPDGDPQWTRFGAERRAAFTRLERAITGALPVMHIEGGSAR